MISLSIFVLRSIFAHDIVLHFSLAPIDTGKFTFGSSYANWMNQKSKFGESLKNYVME